MKSICSSVSAISLCSFVILRGPDGRESIYDRKFVESEASRNSQLHYFWRTYGFEDNDGKLQRAKAELKLVDEVIGVATDFLTEVRGTISATLSSIEMKKGDQP